MPSTASSRPPTSNPAIAGLVLSAPATAWPRLRLVLLGLGISAVPLDTAVNIAFPKITGSFGLPIPMIQWVIICYVLANAGPLLAFGRVGDIWGHGRVFRVGLGWSAAAFLLCAAAPSFGWLLFFRVLQGFGAALVISCAPALVTALYTEARRSHALGVFTLIFAISSALGPLIGGALVARWGWPAVFWFRAPVALTSLLLLRGLPSPPAGRHEHQFDLVGALLLAGGLAGLLLAINAVPRLAQGDRLALAVIPGALACLAAFAWWETRSPQPIVRVELFRNPGFTAINLASCLMYLMTFSVMLFAPYFFPRFTTLPLPLAGLVLAAGFIGMALASLGAGRLVARFGAARVACAGALAAAAGLGLVGLWRAGVPAPLMALELALQGAGTGLFQVAYMELVMAAAPLAHRGVAGSLSMLTRTIGVIAAASGLTLAFQTFQGRALAGGSSAADAFLAAFHVMFWVAAAGALATAAIVAWAARRSRYSSVSPHARTR